MPGQTWTINRQRPHVRPATRGAAERTYEQLYEEAKRRNIQGRSKMSKTELERALGGR
jgi:hypothetical protein